jgi:hypothetical protein
MLVGGVAPIVAQEPQEEDLPFPALETTLHGQRRSDDIIVLTDKSFCALVLGSLWGTDELTYTRLLDRSKKQKKARKAAFTPGADGATVDRCAAILNAYRDPAGTDEAIPTWAREAAVLPDTLARFLPVDTATALATPPEPTDGARTEGFGSRQSAPFTLFGGAYYIEPSTEGCDAWSGVIRRPDAPDTVLATVDGPTNLYDIPLGTWFWDVTASDCDWSVDISPVVLVEATPSPRPLVEVPRLVGSAEWAPQQDNPEYLTVEQARAALDAVGLPVGTCEVATLRIEAPRRVIGQDPAPGTMVEPGTPVNVVVREEGCDVLTG